MTEAGTGAFAGAPSNRLPLLLIPILAALAGLFNSFRMLRLQEPKPSAAVEGVMSRGWARGRAPPRDPRPDVPSHRVRSVDGLASRGFNRGRYDSPSMTNTERSS